MGPPGPTGPSGGSTGAAYPILQPFLNAVIGPQEIPDEGFVQNYGSMALIGIDFDGVDTFTVIEPGLYHLHVVLNIEAGSIANSIVSIMIDDLPNFFASIGNSSTAGQISIIRTQFYPAGRRIRIRNNSTDPISIVNGIPGLFPETNSAGHISFFRFADGVYIFQTGYPNQKLYQNGISIY